MQLGPKQNEIGYRLKDCSTPIKLATDADYFSMGHQRSIKRAKSIKDAYPPSSPLRSNSVSSAWRKRSHHSLRSMARSRENKLESSRGYDFSLALSLDSSDSESLPDLSDSNSMTDSTQSAITPTKVFASAPFSFDLTSSFACSSPPQIARPKSHSLSPASIFDIPELVYKIIVYADIQNADIQKERQPIRRRPLSLQHATLLHDGNIKQAKLSMNTSSLPEEFKSDHGVLHTCLLVNKLFNRITRQVLGTRVAFNDDIKFSQFIESDDSVLEVMRPRSVVLNKLFGSRQASLDQIANRIDFSSLQCLEIFMSPRLIPSSSLLHFSLKSFIVTASKSLDDSTIISLAERCPNLETLDVRACEGVTDFGIYSIASKCSELRSVNLGRKGQGGLITDHSVAKLAANNSKLHTVGLAGCHITDRTIWQLAMNCGKSLVRLSLNSCPKITNNSVPVILSHNMMPNLSVLEIRFIDALTNFDPIVSFKRRQNARGISVLIETCEALLHRLKACEKKLDFRISRNIFQDISEWANKNDDEDISYEDFLRTRHALVRPIH